MKLLTKLVVLMTLQISSVCFAGDTYVRGYVRPSTGQYVMPYHRTAPDSNPYNNYSAGIVPNPYQPAEIHQAPAYEPIHIQQINPMTGDME